ncbi:TonB-dependent receptor plug domain-containing protein [Brevundimonas sp. DC300-4]|uniref:TonB-dependent receptor plug domain-containing protein n=1 Tax=Brevundimonas sp. DC300-4 TaxID=2804594 RepID=UPI003CE91041
MAVGRRSVCALAGAAVLGLNLVISSAALAQASVALTVDANVTNYPATFFTEFRPVTALDMIGRIPGFQFDGGTSGRGFAGTVGNILIDGERPPVRSDSLQSILSRIPAAQVVRIDIVRAGAGGIDMQGKAVVANVIRRPDGGVSGSVSASVTDNTQGRLQPNLNLQARRQWDGRSLEASLSAYQGSGDNHGIRERRSPTGALLLLARSQGVFDFHGVSGTTVYEGPFGGGRIRLNGLVDVNGSGYEGDDILIVPFGRETSLSESTQTKGEIGLRWTRSLPLGATLEVLGSQQLIDNDSIGSYDTPDFTSATVSDGWRGESIGSGSLKFASLETPWGSIDFEAGSEIAFNFVESGTAYLFDGSPLLLPGDDTRVEELRSESFVSGVWTPRENLSVTGALRYERSRITTTGSGGGAETDLSFLKPRLNVAWTPAPGHQMAFKLERNVDQLSFGAFQASAAFSTGIFGRGNPDIRPAQIWLTQARYERVFGRQGSFVAELTHEAYDDVLGQVVVFETPPGYSTPRQYNVTRNVGTATRETAKFTGRLPLDSYGMRGGIASATLQLRQSETRDPVTLLERRLSGEQPVTLSLGLSQNLVSQGINWSVSASTARPGRSFGPSTLSRFSIDPTFNAGLSWRPDDRLSLGGGVTVSGGSNNEFVLFGAPRDRGVPVYSETSRSNGTISAYGSVRRSF